MENVLILMMEQPNVDKDMLQKKVNVFVWKVSSITAAFLVHRTAMLIKWVTVNVSNRTHFQAPRHALRIASQILVLALMDIVSAISAIKILDRQTKKNASKIIAAQLEHTEIL